MKNNVLLILLAACITITLLANCGSSGGAVSSSAPIESAPSSNNASNESATEITDTDAERKVISMWFWGTAPFQRDAMEEHLVNAFNNSQDRYTLEVEYRSSVDDNISVALSANKGPDIVYGSGPAFVSGYAGAGKFVNLDKYAEQYGWRDRLLDPFYEACTIDGSLFSIPGALTTTGVYYNQKVLDDNGWPVPATIEEMEAIMDEAIEKGMYASVTGAKGWRPTNECFINITVNHLAGPEILYKSLTGEIDWTSDEMKASLEKCNEWYQKGYFAGNDYFNFDYNDAAQMMADGKSPFWFGPLNIFQFIQKVATPEQAENIKFMAFPNFNKDLPDPTYDIGCICSFSVNAASENPDGAAEVLNLMLTPEFSANMSLEWPGYWGMPIKNLKDVDVSGSVGMSESYLATCFSIIETVEKGNFGYAAATFYPPSTFQRFVDIDTVWEGVATIDELVEEIDQAYKDDAAQNLVPPIPMPALP